MSNPSDLKNDRRFLALALLVSLPLLAVHLLFPLSGDNEVYQSMATDLLRFHLLPYIGSWDINFPGIVYYHWLSIVLVGNSALAFHFFDLLIHLLLSWMLYWLLRRWLTPLISFLSVVLYNFHYCSGVFETSGQRDAIAMFFLLTGTVLLYQLRDKPTARASFQIPAALGAGASFAAMVLIRVTNLSFVLIAILFLAAIRPKRISRIVFYIIGASVLVLAVILPYAFIHGGFKQMYLATFAFNLEVYGQIRYPISFLFRELRLEKFYLVLVIAGIAFTSIRALREYPVIRVRLKAIRPFLREDKLLFAAYLLAAIVSFLVMGKYWSEHFEPVLFIVMPFAALGMYLGVSALPRKGYRIIAILLLILYPMLRIFPSYAIQPLAESIFYHTPYDFTDGLDIADTGFSERVDAAVANYIDRTSPPGSRFECASIMAGIRWRASSSKFPHQSASRFTTFYPISMATPNGKRAPFQQKWRKEYIDSFRSAKPYYLVLSTVAPIWVGPRLEPPSRVIHTIPGFDSEIFPHYRFDTVMGTYVIWKRRN